MAALTGTKISYAASARQIMRDMPDCTLTQFHLELLRRRHLPHTRTNMRKTWSKARNLYVNLQFERIASDA